MTRSQETGAVTIRVGRPETGTRRIFDEEKAYAGADGAVALSGENVEAQACQVAAQVVGDDK